MLVVIYILGDSQWELRQSNRNFLAVISDKKWIEDFHARKVEIRPKDALYVSLKETYHYDSSNEVIKTSYEILEVKDVISGGEQLDLFD